MRILAIVAACACLFSGSATAQDATGWNGFYAGIIANAATGQMTNQAGGKFSTKGALLSGAAGYRFPAGSFVAGVEGQINLGSAGFSYTQTLPYISFEDDFDIYPTFSVTGSIGMPTNDFLPFVFGGISVGAGYLHEHIGPGSSPPPGFPVVTSPDLNLDAVHLGLTAGAGIDARLADNLLLRGQYTFFNMMKSSYSGPVSFGSTIHMLGVGLLYQF
jgi:outer membrane immunogenic protein